MMRREIAVGAIQGEEVILSALNGTMTPFLAPRVAVRESFTDTVIVGKKFGGVNIHH